MRNVVDIVSQLTADEDIEQFVYNDSLGFATIGVGRCVDKRKGKGLSLSEIHYLLTNDIADVRANLNASLPWWITLDTVRQGVLINMGFQLGVHGLLGFPNMLAHVKAGDWNGAADEMLASLWARQTPARAQRLANQMRTGQWT